MRARPRRPYAPPGWGGRVPPRSRNAALCHHLSGRHPFLHVVTEHRAHVDQYEQHARDAQSEHGRFRRTRFHDGDRLVCKNPQKNPFVKSRP